MMSERFNSTHEHGSERQATISELLPRYYEAHGDDLLFETIRSMMIDGHEVAWMEYIGHVGGREDKEYRGRELRCACHFTEGVGWGVDEKYGVHNIYRSSGSCLPLEKALVMRQVELRYEYLEKFRDDAISFGDESDLWDHISEIMLDLIEKGKNGEWLSEASSGANDWGGYYYLQTVHEITKIPYEELWKNVYKMYDDKLIVLEGMVVQEYREPPKPRWSEYGRYEIDRYTVIVYIPDHSKMPQRWQYSVYDKIDEKFVMTDFPGSKLMYSPDFGADVSDVTRAEQNIEDIMKFLKETYEKNEAITSELMDEFAQVLRGEWKASDENHEDEEDEI